MDRDSTHQDGPPSRSKPPGKLKEFYWTVTRAIGLGHLHRIELNKEIIRFIARVFSPFLSAIARAGARFNFLLFSVIAQLLSRLGVRFINVPCLQIERIGHFAVDIDAYLKDHLLSNQKIIPILICGDCKPNEALLAHWSKHIHVIHSRWIIRLLRPLMVFPELATKLLNYCMVGWQAWDTEAPFARRRGASPVYDIQNRWGSRPPLLHLSEAEIARGEAELRALGVPEGAWFVCVHSRESGYTSPSYEAPPEDTSSFRNSNISDYAEAMQAIVARGGWCIRVGDPTMKPLDPMPGVIEYALSSSKSDWMDVFLCARCHFFLGGCSGLFGLAGIFGRPSALANITPLCSAYTFFINDITIVKLLKDADGRLMSWPDAFAGEASELRKTSEFVERGLVQIDNTPQEIAELAIEMMDRLEGIASDEPDDIDLQTRFRALLRPRHYAWKASSRIGRSFLRRHRDLLTANSILKSDIVEEQNQHFTPNGGPMLMTHMPNVSLDAPHLDDAFLDRVRKSYELTARDDSAGKDSMWTEISKIKMPIHEALVAGDNHKLREIFADPRSSDLYYGMDFLAKSFLLHDSGAGYDVKAPKQCYDELLRLAEAIGLRRWLPPDNELAQFYYPPGHELSPDIENVLRSVSVVLGMDISFPNPFPNEPGIQTSRGIASYRPIHALYQTYRISQELRGSPNQSILEIGPGMGRTAFFAWQAGFRDYTTIDLPIGIAGQACFLCAVLGPDAIWMAGDDPGLAEGRIRLLPSTAALPENIRFGLVLNVDSLTEMGELNSARYAAWIATHADVFISINHETNAPTIVDLAQRFFASAESRRWLYWMRQGWVEEVFWFIPRSDRATKISPAADTAFLAPMIDGLRRTKTQSAWNEIRSFIRTLRGNDTNPSSLVVDLHDQVRMSSISTQSNSSMSDE